MNGTRYCAEKNANNFALDAMTRHKQAILYSFDGLIIITAADYMEGGGGISMNY